jgi:hypothetical protein
LEEFELTAEKLKQFLTPLNGFQFPHPGKQPQIRRPRPPGKNPLEWMSEND